jgi:ABC-type transport system involved in cytochrome c biogenesis permease component
MIFLPIARRELRVAATKRNTMWLRLAGAVVALLIGSLGFAIEMASNPVPSVGRTLFQVLTCLACFAALSTGIYLTSDSLSEEKREGTLGFLFLTDLRGYDIVSGKFLAAGLRGFYMLLAAFPILAITLLMGGVTGVGLWKTCLALLNALFASLIAGIFISSVSREAQRAIMGTMLSVGVWAGAGYLIDLCVGQTFFKLSSPVFVFDQATGAGRRLFWEALLVNQVLAWLVFAAGSFFAARTWHDKPEKTTSPLAAFVHWIKYPARAPARKADGREPDHVAGMS